MLSFLNGILHKKAQKNDHHSDISEPSQKDIRVPDESVVSDTKQSVIQPFTVKSHLETPQIIVGIAQSSGLQRDSNEDSLFTLTTNIISKNKTLVFGLYAVADGMGGHDFGELASSLAIEKFSTDVINAFYLPVLSSTDDPLDISIQEVLQSSVVHAHRMIKESLAGSGTTLTAALILGEQLTIAHVGDSRAYTINSDGEMHLLTHDHSLVKRLEEIGQLSPEEAEKHPKRNLLYRALGQGDPIEPEINNYQVHKGVNLLICSDGLWGVVPDNDIKNIILSSSDPEIACQSLVHTANAAGGPDNISVILVHIPL